MNIHVKSLSSEAFSSAQNAANIVQRLGSVHPGGGAYSTPTALPQTHWLDKGALLVRGDENLPPVNIPSGSTIDHGAMMR